VHFLRLQKSRYTKKLEKSNEKQKLKAKDVPTPQKDAGMLEDWNLNPGILEYWSI
jgi:hypothetical protein